MSKVIIICFSCKKDYEFELTEQQVSEIHDGEKFIQDILPDFSPEDREMFISQICPKCWDEIFSDDD